MAPNDDALEKWEVWDQGAIVPGKGLKYFLLQQFWEGMNEKSAVATVANLRQSVHNSVDAFYDCGVLAVDCKNFCTLDHQKDMEEYKVQLCIDKYTFIVAGFNKDIRKLVLGVPNPPTELMGLHAAACNAESELKKSIPSSSVHETSQENVEAPSTPATTSPNVDLTELKTALVAAIKGTVQRT